MRRTTLLLVLLLSVTVLLPASIGRQEIIPLTSAFYEDMDLLYLIAGFGTPSGSRPWSKAEAAQLLASIDRSNLKGSGKRLYDSLQQEIDSGLRWEFGDDFGFSAYLDLAVEGYAHTNTDFNSQGAWEYSFIDRRPLAKARLAMAISDTFYTYVDMQYGYGPYIYDDQLPTLVEANHQQVGALIPNAADRNLRFFDADTPLIQYTKYWADNLLSASKHFDFQWPKRAVFSLGNERMNFTFSRDKISWGNSKIGNFILNNHVDFHDYLRFTIFSRYFKYETTTLLMDAHFADYDHIRLFLTHRLEFRPWEKLSIAVSENVMYKDHRLQLSFLNPAFILHNLNYASLFNAIAHAEIAYVPLPSLRFFGQFVLDQATAPNEGENEEVAAWGVSGGLEYGVALKQGVLSAVFEAAMATPHLYRRRDVDFLMSHRYAGLQGGGGYWETQKFDYIGFPYGGDALVFLAQTRYRIPESLAVGLTLKQVLKGEVTMYTPLDDYKSEYGTSLFVKDKIKNTFSATLDATYTVIAPPRWIGALEFYIAVSLRGRGEYLQSTKGMDEYSWDTQLVLSTRLSL